MASAEDHRAQKYWITLLSLLVNHTCRWRQSILFPTVQQDTLPATPGQGVLFSSALQLFSGLHWSPQALQFPIHKGKVRQCSQRPKSSSAAPNRIALAKPLLPFSIFFIRTINRLPIGLKEIGQLLLDLGPPLFPFPKQLNHFPLPLSKDITASRWCISKQNAGLFGSNLAPTMRVWQQLKSKHSGFIYPF